MKATPAEVRRGRFSRSINFSHSLLCSRASVTIQVRSIVFFIAALVVVPMQLRAGNSEQLDGLGSSLPIMGRSATDQSAQVSREQATQALDRLRDKVEQWGVITISAPVAILDDSAFYVPDNIRSASDLYKDAQTEVGASAVQALEIGVGNQFTGVATPTTIIPSAPVPPRGGTSAQTTSTTTTVTAPSGATAAPTTAPTPRQLTDSGGKPIPTLDAEGLPLPSPGTETFGFKDKEMTAPFGLSPSITPTKGITESLRETQDNLMRQNIYSQMSYPKEVPGYNHVIFGIVQVSCNPGWRTKEHYIGECSASLEYYDLGRKRYLSRAARRTPRVFSVLPLIDAQTIEMANSQREVTQLAFQLAASLPARGVDVKAKDLFQFVRRYSRDLRSRTPIPVVNSFSSGGTFGFRFSPSFQAMRDPAQKNARAANVLLPTSFPALITVVVDQSDLEYLERTEHPGELGLLAHVSTRWHLKDRAPLWQLPKRFFTPMRRDTAEIEVNAAEDVKTVYDAKDKFGATSDFPFNPMYEEMRREIVALEEKGVGKDWPIPFNEAIFSQEIKADQRIKDDLMRRRAEQPQKTPVDRIEPAEVTMTGNDFKLLVSGKGLNTIKTAMLGNVRATTVEPIGESIVIPFPALTGSDGDSPDLRLFDTRGGVITVRNAVTLHARSRASADVEPEKGTQTPANADADKTPETTPDAFSKAAVQKKTKDDKTSKAAPVAEAKVTADGTPMPSPQKSP